MYSLNENISLKELSQILGFENIETDARIKRIVFDSKIATKGDLSL